MSRRRQNVFRLLDGGRQLGEMPGVLGRRVTLAHYFCDGGSAGWGVDEHGPLVTALTLAQMTMRRPGTLLDVWLCAHCRLHPLKELAKGACEGAKTDPVWGAAALAILRAHGLDVETLAGCAVDAKLVRLLHRWGCLPEHLLRGATDGANVGAVCVAAELVAGIEGYRDRERPLKQMLARALSRHDDLGAMCGLDEVLECVDELRDLLTADRALRDLARRVERSSRYAARLRELQAKRAALEQERLELDTQIWALADDVNYGL